MVGFCNVTPDSESLPRWVIPLGNWAWDALTDDTPLTDGPVMVPRARTRCAGSSSRPDVELTPRPTDRVIAEISVGAGRS